MEASRNIFFSHLLITKDLSKIDKGTDLGFFPKKRENDDFCSTGTSFTDALCKKQEGVVLSRFGKKVTKVTQARIYGRLKGKVKFSWRLISNVKFPGATRTLQKVILYCFEYIYVLCPS